ncbi:MAG: hypothetical protein LHW51_13520 [Candidatus Cloacimonetes bacterium]|jgi:hypothetical protein|nr:hypothetical protein [Candidatus Cloacimonadota bacterium]MCB5260106.1 hypothetical protein [Candidatus Cloacimonadota bacterium]
MFNFFYWFFYPQLAMAQWHSYMLEGIIFSAAFISCLVIFYAILPYNRKRERFKFFSCNLFILLAAIVFVIIRTSSIPDEICRDGYKWLFGFSLVIATLIYGLLTFWIFSTLMGAKKYFARINEYFRK